MRILYLQILLLFSLVFIFTSCDTIEPGIIDYHNKILFMSNRSGENQLHIMNPSGTDIRQITSGKYSHGRWSPDAQKIVCNTEEGSTTAGSNRILLGYGSQMSWYPDGSDIIFSYLGDTEIGIYDNKLFCINPNGGTKKFFNSIYAGRFRGRRGSNGNSKIARFIKSYTRINNRAK